MLIEIFLVQILFSLTFQEVPSSGEIMIKKLPQTLFSSYNNFNGYSTSKKSIVKSECFFANTIEKGEIIRRDDLSSSFTYNNLLEELKLLNYTKNPNFVLKGNNLMKHLQNIKDDDLSFSISYLLTKFNEYKVTYHMESREGLLTAEGLEIYTNNKKNFSFLCGDNVITSYNKGIGLLYSIKLEFHTKEDKLLFEENQGQDYGEFQYILTKLANKINYLNINGMIEIKYIQLGGNTELFKEKINPNGEKCEFTKLSNCEDTLKQLMTYSDKEFLEQFKTHPFNYEIIQVNEMVSVREFLDLPQFDLEPNIRNSQDFILDFANRYNYYLLYLQTVPYYPVYSEPLNKYLRDTEDLLKLFYSVDPLSCFEYANKTCVDIYAKMYDILNQTQLEANIIKTISGMKTYSIYPTVFKDDLCLKGKMRWDKEYNLNMYMFPNGKGKGIAIYSSDFKFANTKVDDVNEDFSLDLIDGPFNFNIQVHNKKNKNMAMVTCIEKSKKITKSFNVIKEDKENPFYFEKYDPRKN